MTMIQKLEPAIMIGSGQRADTGPFKDGDKRMLPPHVVESLVQCKRARRPEAPAPDPTAQTTPAAPAPEKKKKPGPAEASGPAKEE